MIEDLLNVTTLDFLYLLSFIDIKVEISLSVNIFLRTGIKMV